MKEFFKKYFYKVSEKSLGKPPKKEGFLGLCHKQWSMLRILLLFSLTPDPSLLSHSLQEHTLFNICITGYFLAKNHGKYPFPAYHWAGVNRRHQKFIFEYQVFSQKSYLNTGCFEKIHICIPKF